MLELFKHAGVVAYPLGICSVLALGIILERIFTLTRIAQLEEKAFMVLQLALEKGDDSPLRDQQLEPAPVARIIGSLAELRGAGIESIQQAAEIAISLQRLRLRKY